MRSRRPVLLALTRLGFGLPWAWAEAGTSSKKVDLTRSIRPIFSGTCFTCHGPDAQARMADLRFDVRDGGAFEERDGRRVIVPGDSAKSVLFQRVRSTDQATRMPPVSSGMKLTENQIELIQQWIDEGAKWESHSLSSPPCGEPSQEVVAYCQSGTRASLTYIALRLLGFPRVRMYDGSWAEWSIHAELPVEK